MNDNQLLHRYVTARDQAAFAELTQRHSAWIFSAARRLVSDSSLAEDVTQATFLLLARKASGLLEHGNLAAWLFNTMRYCAREAQRQRIRQYKREQEAAAMRSEVVSEANWDQIAPVLESAVSKIPAKDRQAVLLRFYQQLSLAEVGSEMGISEDAARKRIARALEKLRDILGRKGIAAGAIALGAVLTEKATQAAPATLQTGIATSIHSGGVGASAAIAKGAGQSLLIAQVKVIAAIAACVVAMTGGAIIAMMPENKPPVPKTPPPAAAPVVTTIDPSPIVPPKVDFVARGVVLNSENRPIAGVQVHGRSRDPGSMKLSTAETQTDAQGRFELRGLPMPPAGHIAGSIVIDAPGYALAWKEVTREQIFTDDLPHLFQLKKPQPIEGLITDQAGQPIRGATVRAWAVCREPEYYGYLSADNDGNLTANTDETGRFVLPRFPDGTRAHLIVLATGFAEFNSQVLYRGDTFPYPAGMKDVRIALKPGGSCSATLRPIDGQPIAGVRLIARGNSGTYGIATTDEGGRATFSALAAGEYTIEAGETWTAANDVKITPGQQVDITLEPRAVNRHLRELRGIVIHERSGKRVASDVQISSIGSTPACDILLTADAHGEFSAKLPPGEYDLSAHGWVDGQPQRQHQKVTIPAQGDLAPVVLKILPRRMMRGILLNPEGHPVAGAIDIWHTEFVGPDGRFEAGEPNTSWSTDGKSRCYAVSEDKKLGIVFEYDVRHPLDEFRLVLQPLMTIKGRVIDAQGTPVKLAPDELTLLSGNSGRHAQYFRFESTLGEFTLTRIPAGIPLDLLINSGGLQRKFNLKDMQPGEVRDLGLIDMAAGASPERRPIPMMDASIRGRIVGPDGKGIVGLNVACLVDSAPNPQHDTTDAEGRFVLQKLPAHQKVILGCSSEIYGQAYLRDVATGKTDLVWLLKPIAADLIGKPAPELRVAQWLKGRLPEFKALRGQVVMIRIGGRLTPRDYNYSEQEFARVAMLYADKRLTTAVIINPLPEESDDYQLNADDTLAFIDERKLDFAVGIDKALPQKPLQPGEMRVYPRDLPDYFNVTQQAYDQRGFSSVYLIDKKGIVRSAVPGNDLETKVKELLTEE